MLAYGTHILGENISSLISVYKIQPRSAQSDFIFHITLTHRPSKTVQWGFSGQAVYVCVCYRAVIKERTLELATGLCSNQAVLNRLFRFHFKGEFTQKWTILSVFTHPICCSKTVLPRNKQGEFVHFMYPSSPWHFRDSSWDN